MTKYPIAIYADHPEAHFEHRTAARLARVSQKFIQQCEDHELVTCRYIFSTQKRAISG